MNKKLEVKYILMASGAVFLPTLTMVLFDSDENEAIKSAKQIAISLYNAHYTHFWFSKTSGMIYDQSEDVGSIWIKPGFHTAEFKRT